MDVVHELAASGAEAGTAVLAGEQLEGRGSRGRSWDSPPGGLWLSVLFRPPVADGLEVISLRAGLAIAEGVQALVPQPLQLKWPNDLMLGARKLGGVLCEARWQGDALGWIAVGVGLNVRNVIPADLDGSVVALSSVAPAVTVQDVGDHVLPALRGLQLGMSQLAPEELAQFANRDWLRGRTIREPAAGTVQGISADGALLVRTPAGSQIAIRSGLVVAQSLTPGNFDHAARAGHRQH
jgi:BirA family transcriptional regulator, biotin operon repressor / biotin---[acetyl-CoA-carboxylase] ligase